MQTLKSMYLCIINQEVFAVVESFKYLRLMFHESGRYSEMIEHRLAQGKRVFAA